MDITTLRKNFPMLEEKYNDKDLIYVDSAATSLTPQVVIDKLDWVYKKRNANVHRSIHSLAGLTTKAYEESRNRLKSFLNAKDSSEIIFTKGTTDSINWLARGLVEENVTEGDYILVTVLEHHANLVPWQEVCKRTGAKLIYAPLDDNYQVDLDALSKMDASRIKVFAVQHVSNVLGVTQDLKAIGKWTKANDILLLVDGAQAASHIEIDVQDLEVDSYSFSGHKMNGPFGIGVTYLRKDLHDITSPSQYGGQMITYVGDYEAKYAKTPAKFEGGTPPIAEAIALGVACDFTEENRNSKRVYELTKYFIEGLEDIGGIQLFKVPDSSYYNGIVSFNIEGAHPHDASSFYDQEAIALRAGHHCCQPLMRYLNVMATLRVSISSYNTKEELDKVLFVTRKIKEYFI